MNRYKNIKVGLITGFILLAFSLMFTGWNDTLVKKTDLTNYSTNEQLEKTFVTKADYNTIEERTRMLVENSKRMELKIDAIILHHGIALKDKKDNCPFPPCVEPKKKKNSGIARN
jgi:hypothetical protein